MALAGIAQTRREGRAPDQARSARQPRRSPVQPAGADRGRRRQADRSGEAGRRSAPRCAAGAHRRRPAITTARSSAPTRSPLIDEAGSLTFAELESRSNSLARALRESGVEGGESVAVMCRNHRGFVDAIFACSKLGATVLLMNTDFAGPQLHGVIEREQPRGDHLRLRVPGAPRRAPRRTLRTSRASSPGSTRATRSPSRRPRTRSRPPPTSRSTRPTRRAASSSSPPGRPGRRRAPSAPRPDSLAPLAVLLSKIPLRSERHDR